MARKAECSINVQSVMAELKKVAQKNIYDWSTLEVFGQNGTTFKGIGCLFLFT
jgi:hypothetical protein